MAILTGKDAILKEVRDCVMRDDPDRLQEISPYLFSYWRDLSVKHGCVCLDERIAIPKSIKDAVLEDIHSTHPGSFAMLSLAQNIWWPYIHRDILAKASECKACTEIGKNLKVNTTPFDAHFGRKCNKLISNITTKPNSKNLSYNALLNYYLDEDTIPGRSYLSEEQWADTALCLDTEIERVMCAASVLARAEQEKRKDGEERFLNSEDVSRPIPCSERSVQVKLARKLYENQRQKKNLDGLYEVLAPGSTECKVSPTTSVIKEPHKQEVRVRNSDIAKFGTRAERDTDLAQYIERTPKKINEKTIEHKIYKHKSDLIRKNTGDKKIKRNRRQSDDVSVVSSGRSCISSASNIARSLKMRIPKRNPKHDKAFLNRPDSTQILRFSLIAPQLTTSYTAGPSATQMPSSVQPTPTPILRKTTKRQITISDTSDSDTSSVRKSKRTLKKMTPKSQTIIEKVRNTEGYSDNANQDIGDARNSTEWVKISQGR